MYFAWFDLNFCLCNKELFLNFLIVKNFFQVSVIYFHFSTADFSLNYKIYEMI